MMDKFKRNFKINYQMSFCTTEEMLEAGRLADVLFLYSVDKQH